MFPFLHPKSFEAPGDWGPRDDMFAHVASLKRKLDKVVGPEHRANCIVMGALNTMGLNAPWRAGTVICGLTQVPVPLAAPSHLA